MSTETQSEHNMSNTSASKFADEMFLNAIKKDDKTKIEITDIVDEFLVQYHFPVILRY